MYRRQVSREDLALTWPYSVVGSGGELIEYGIDKGGGVVYREVCGERDDASGRFVSTSFLIGMDCSAFLPSAKVGRPLNSSVLRKSMKGQIPR